MSKHMKMKPQYNSKPSHQKKVKDFLMEKHLRAVHVMEPGVRNNYADHLDNSVTLYKCGVEHYKFCGMNGICYYYSNDSNGPIRTCQCNGGFFGDNCEFTWYYAKHFDRSAQLTLLLSVVGLIFAITILLALLFVIWRVWRIRKSRLEKQKLVACSLDDDINNINNELDKLTHEEKLVTTTRAALVTFPGPSKTFMKTGSVSGNRFQTAAKTTRLSSIKEKPYGQSYRRFSAPTLFDPALPESQKLEKLASVMGRMSRLASKTGARGDQHGGDDCMVFVSL
ncbi:hypothetical protein HELRODRAFT_183201 [Helobdella robusta]|uniref:EGF-like domain-containing protein n=1 Tax=Helobdella robusta TaxID=6412 RepID=T1FJA6_HELRO|nr:hypothetical protein HELRODRAFT_183201 [Helobdella robusta]ESO11415.1 hypothetical protein HELRODRAFT_183201 [Helobdella robusta]